MILEYYDVLFDINADNNFVRLIPKKEKQITNNKCSHIGSTLNWFIHYYGDEVGTNLWNERKSLYSIPKLYNWYLQNFNCDESTKNKLLIGIETFGKKVSDKLNKHYASDEGDVTREKLKLARIKSAPITAKKNSDKWKDVEWRKKRISDRIVNGTNKKIGEARKKALQRPDVKNALLKRVRSPENRKRVSEWAKQLWVDAKKNPELYYKMINTAKHKVYVLDNIHMNHIEYIVGVTLKELCLEYEYEKLFTVGVNTYIPDFYIPKYNLIVECYGDFWHANPKLFNESDYTHKTRCAKDIWKYDENKMRVFNENGYKYIVLWESDILNNPQLIRENILCNM